MSFASVITRLLQLLRDLLQVCQKRFHVCRSWLLSLKTKLPKFIPLSLSPGNFSNWECDFSLVSKIVK